MPEQHFHLGSNYIIYLLQGKWKISIVCALGIRPMFYGQLLRYERDINQQNIAKKVLTEQLNQLIKAKIVKKYVYHTVPARVKYMLTSEGQELSDLLLQLNRVGERISKKTGDIEFDISADQADAEHSTKS